MNNGMEMGIHFIFPMRMRQRMEIILFAPSPPHILMIFWDIYINIQNMTRYYTLIQDLQDILNLFKHYINSTIIPLVGLNPFPNLKSRIQKID